MAKVVLVFVEGPLCSIVFLLCVLKFATMAGNYIIVNDLSLLRACTHTRTVQCDWHSMSDRDEWNWDTVIPFGVYVYTVYVNLTPGLNQKESAK